ncbi:putative capsid vertex protein [Escherichia phage vB_EcoM_G5211]|nr:putative capsid vertex protein [Escherichia phage vB_EcoM_G2494]QBO66407.1 putative capsid vertex protein [Escherichia phage vB_EcoM_G5211]
MTHIFTELLRESTSSVANQTARPQLLSLTRAVNNLIFSDLVAIQPTDQPVSALYGLRYLNRDGQMTFRTAATYGGAAGDRTEIEEFSKEKSYDEGALFKSGDVVYEVVTAGTVGEDAETPESAIFKGVMTNKIRFYSDCASVEYFEDKNTEIASTSMQFDKWQVNVGSRKLKTSFTTELMQDLEASQINSENSVIDLLATVASEEINKDIIQKLITVSSRYKIKGITPDGVLSLVSVQDAPTQSRELYRYACEMSNQMLRTSSFAGTYVLASSRVVGLLQSSGWMEETDNALSEGRLRCGLEVYADTTTPFDYMLVGCKHMIGDMESVGSLFYSPYTEADGAGAYKSVIDPNSFQHHVAIMNRYSLSVNPYTSKVDQEEHQVIKGDDWGKMAGRSEMSYILGIELPPLEIDNA